MSNEGINRAFLVIANVSRNDADFIETALEANDFEFDSSMGLYFCRKDLSNSIDFETSMSFFRKNEKFKEFTIWITVWLNENSSNPKAIKWSQIDQFKSEFGFEVKKVAYEVWAKI